MVQEEVRQENHKPFNVILHLSSKHLVLNTNIVFNIDKKVVFIGFNWELGKGPIFDV